MLGRAIDAYGPSISLEDLKTLACGLLTPAHAQQFVAFANLRERAHDLSRRGGGHGVAGGGQPTWIFSGNPPALTAAAKTEHTDRLSEGIRRNIARAVEIAGAAARGEPQGKRNPNSLAERARSWFMANYPLLGALAAVFEIVEDEALCARMDIALAAVDPELRKVYINPKFPWTYEGMQFVMAHELLHVGLRHEQRRQGREPFLWNVACDYVINGWLLEMNVGVIPTDDLLLDPELGFERESAEAIYGRIVKDLRLMRRLAKARTMRGAGRGDVLGERAPGRWLGPGCDLDAFYRRALADGLDLHLTVRRLAPRHGLCRAGSAAG
jgi:hypothetical protein